MISDVTLFIKVKQKSSVLLFSHVFYFFSDGTGGYR